MQTADGNDKNFLFFFIALVGNARLLTCDGMRKKGEERRILVGAYQRLMADDDVQSEVTLDLFAF